VESGYFPTARQVRAIVELRAQETAPVEVIVGGSSVMYGVGQHESLIWTRFLQQHLGSDFRVVNFSQRGGSAADFGNVAAELLLRQGRPVVFIASASITDYTGALEASFYRHLIFDAWHRNYLLPWPPRDQLLANAIWRGPATLRGPALGALLDAHLNFNDLWSFVSYEYANSNWNQALGERSFQPRSGFQDPDPTPEYYTPLRYAHDLNETMRIVRGQILSSDNPRWERVMRLTDQMVPPELRAVTLAVIELNSPYYLDRLNPAERAAFIAQAHEHGQRLEKIGFRSAMVAATALAPAVRAMAEELRYLP
jgi:hypothetical protein